MASHYLYMNFDSYIIDCEYSATSSNIFKLVVQLMN